MSTRKRSKGSEKEIDSLVTSQVDDDAAWEPPVSVSPSSSPRPVWMASGKHLELAAKFHVLSVLHRLGAEANLTLVQPDNVDITVVHKSGQALTIDVKTLTGTTEWQVQEFKARKHHFVVFVCFLEALRKPDATPTVYVVGSQQLQHFVHELDSEKLSIDLPQTQIGVRDPWRQLISDPAA